MTIKLSKNLDVSGKMERWLLYHLINLMLFYFKMTLLSTNMQTKLFLYHVGILKITSGVITPYVAGRAHNWWSEKMISFQISFDVIGTEMEQIHSSYGLLGKVIATITDNASNSAKALKIYQPVYSESEALSTETDGQIILPPHYRGASHTINLISPVMLRNT